MNRLDKIAAAARTLNVDAILLTSEVNMQYATLYPRLEGMVIIDADGCGICLTDSRYIEDAARKMTPQGYQVIEPEGSYPTVQTVADYIAEKHYQRVAYEDNRMTAATLREYQSAIQAELVPMGDAVEELRQIKEPQEIEWITKAQRIAERALERLLPEIRVGAYEDELCALLRYYMAMDGSTGYAPGMILVGGTTTSMPHGQPTHKRLEAGTFVTIDYGAEWNGYQSDMTRTFALGSYTERMALVYHTVQQAQEAGIEAFEAGRSGAEVDSAARSVIERAGFGQYFGHGLGHSLGLEIHENPRASRTYHKRFVTSNIITVEPGIYIPGEFGVRIEDMIWLPPEGGKENLTRFPKELTVLDA